MGDEGQRDKDDQECSKGGTAMGHEVLRWIVSIDDSTNERH
jgi:hypothetical protein